MLIFDSHIIGSKLYQFRKKLGMTQAEVAESAGLSDRTYANIERGSVNMRIETVLRICNVLHITPDEILTEDILNTAKSEKEVLDKLNACPPKERKNALRILAVYLDSLE